MKKIILTDSDKEWIKMTKNHYESKYPFKGSWVETLKPLFSKQYGWSPDDNKQYNHQDYLSVLFNRLLDIQVLITDDMSGNNNQVRSIFDAAFYKTIMRPDELPLERAIAALCGLIQCNKVLNDDGTKRYEL